MSLRADILDGIKSAMKEKDKMSLSTLRLVNAAIKDRDIAARAEDRPEGIDDAQVLSILAKMVKQREESARIYDDNERPELAIQERGEIDVIKRYMPAPLTVDEVQKAVKSAIDTLDATCLKDMGKVMGKLKSEYAGRMDMGQAGGVVKSILAG